MRSLVIYLNRSEKMKLVMKMIKIVRMIKMINMIKKIKLKHYPLFKSGNNFKTNFMSCEVIVNYNCDAPGICGPSRQ
jgi:hypothetical protein